MKHTRIASLVAAALMFASPAISATLDFTDPTTGIFEDPTYSLGGGLSVTVSAGTYSGDAIVDTDVDGFLDLGVSKSSSGLGVALTALPNFAPDVNGPFDLLTFAFTSAVSLNSITFGNVDGNDDFDIFFDGTLAFSDLGIAGANPATFGGVVLNSFSVGADQLSFFNGVDDFTIAGIDVSVAPVPLPAAMPMLLAGLGSLAFARRRRRG